MPKDSAFIIVDVQNDYSPGGAVAVPDGDKVIPVLNMYILYFSHAGALIIASRDWHPVDTTHFKRQGGPWPVHCVQDTEGAMFHPGLDLPSETIIISKGMDSVVDGYSAFDGVDAQGMTLLEILKNTGVKSLYIGGLATDLSVKATVLDCLKHFDVFVLEDAIAGGGTNNEDVRAAIYEMKNAGAKFIAYQALAVPAAKKKRV